MVSNLILVIEIMERYLLLLMCLGFRVKCHDFYIYRGSFG